MLLVALNSDALRSISLNELFTLGLKPGPSIDHDLLGLDNVSRIAGEGATVYA